MERNGECLGHNINTPPPQKKREIQKSRGTVVRQFGYSIYEICKNINNSHKQKKKERKKRETVVRQSR